jgi:hypothetical protein
VKLISRTSSGVVTNRELLEACKNHPFPDGTFVYCDIWDDTDGLAILMDDYQTTLRHRISPHIQLTERQWYSVMLGIVERLAVPHEYDIPHGDLCPSNSIYP